jgi:hypothetical protein
MFEHKNDNLNTINHIFNSNEFAEGDLPLDFYNEEDQKYTNFPLQ